MADLIDRDALLQDMGLTDAVKYGNKTAEQQYRSYSTWMSYEIADSIRDAPSVSRWIPCSERLPENNVPILYVWRSQNGAVAVLHGWHFEIRSLGSAWHQSGVGLHRPDEEVTHWMPLPEPPEMERNA